MTLIYIGYQTVETISVNFYIVFSVAIINWAVILIFRFNSDLIFPLASLNV
jgi:hypothetical protein